MTGLFSDTMTPRLVGLVALGLLVAVILWLVFRATPTRNKRVRRGRPHWENAESANTNPAEVKGGGSSVSSGDVGGSSSGDGGAGD